MQFILWMLPFLGFALVALYVGYVAYETRHEKERASHAPPPGPDPVIELEAINTELARLATQTRKSLENARNAMQKGLKG